MEMEEMKSTPSYLEYTNLGEPLKLFGEKKYTPVVFNKSDLLADETLINLFDGNCATKKVDDTIEYAVGFIGGYLTTAHTSDIHLHISVESNISSLYAWYDQVFENMFGFDAGEIRSDTSIYCAEYNLAIDVVFIEPNHIRLDYYKNN